MNSVSKYLVYFIVLTLSFCISVAKCYAGACLDSTEEFVKSLEKKSLQQSATCPDGQEDCYFCLLNYYFASTNRWGGKNAASVIKESRESRYRSRIYSAGSQLFQESLNKTPPDSNSAFVYAQILAWYGYKKAGTYDLFAILVSRPDDLPLPELAAQNDPRTIDLLIQKYTSLRKKKLSRANREVLISYLNCLYHFLENSVREFAEKTLGTETDPLLKKRLRIIVDRG